MRKLLFILAAAATLTVGCSSSDTVVDGGAGDAGPGSDAGATGPLDFRPSNLDNVDLAAALAAPLGDLVLDDCGPQLASTEDGRAGCDPPGDTYRKLDTFMGGQKYWVFVARNIRVAADRTLAVGGDRPVILVALETIDLAGGITVKEGEVGGVKPKADGKDGDGPGAGKGSSNSSNGSGGGGAFCGRGGNGGATGADGGASYGTTELVPLVGGSSGGGLFAADGGGAIQLVAGREIIVRAAGFIDARGGGAVTGGGSGGAILLEAPAVRVEGSLTANGGGGGAPGGQSGTPGERMATRALGGRNAENVNGGDGGAGSDVDGTNGVTNPSFTDGAFASSGGGGAGRIRVNTRSGAAVITGLVSPALGTPCATQGTLR